MISKSEEWSWMNYSLSVWSTIWESNMMKTWMKMIWTWMTTKMKKMRNQRRNQNPKERRIKVETRVPNRNPNASSNDWDEYIGYWSKIFWAFLSCYLPFLNFLFHFFKAEVNEPFEGTIIWGVVDWFVLIRSKKFDGWVSRDSVFRSCTWVCCHIDCSDVDDSLKNFGSLFILRSSFFTVSAPWSLVRGIWYHKTRQAKINRSSGLNF